MIAYWLRWCWTLLVSFDQPCRARRCGRPTVGFSVWCRRHADEILHAKEGK